ncbi:MAG: DUF1543 domain-containing protein [Ferruginibacter sp.]|nr:DUF1543 domain-containing protein [Chitinophagaceae bacterium]
MKPPRLFMLLLGCKPKQRNTEQHDVFFGIGNELKDLLPAILHFWPEANGKIHIDAWREVTAIDQYRILILPKEQSGQEATATKLFFLNLGGYKPGEFEEFHYRLVVAGEDKGAAVEHAKQTAFYRHTGFKGATSHIDEKYGIDVDDFYEIEDILSSAEKEKYSIIVLPGKENEPDELHLGYTRLEKL